MPLKRDEAFWKEGMDEKRFALCCIHKIWICLAAALAGAVFAAGIYLGVRQLTMGPKQYRSEVLYSSLADFSDKPNHTAFAIKAVGCRQNARHP